MSVSLGALVLDTVLARWLLLIGLLGAESRGGRCVVKGWVFCAGRTVRCLSVDRVIQRCVEVPIGVTPWRRFVAARGFSKLFVGS